MNQSVKNKNRGNTSRAKLKRQQRSKNLLSDSKRQDKQRHTALAKQGSANEGRQKRRENRAVKASGIPKDKEAITRFSSKPDRWFKGRNLYPTLNKQGKTIYLPQKSDATPSELRKGQFVKDVDIGKEVAAGIPPKEDRVRGRNLYPITGTDGTIIYLPQKSDATPAELLKGQFVKDVDVGKEAIVGEAPKPDRWFKGRKLYPTAGLDGKTVYLPQQSEATPSELLKGQFVKDVDAGKEMLNGVDPKPDRWFKGRNLYPTLDEQGKTIYLPQKSDATPAERLKRNYVKDVGAGKDVIAGYTPKEDRKRGRNLYPTLGDKGEMIYLPQERDATPSELQKGQFVKDADAGQEVIEALPKNLRPKIDDQGRVLYPVKVQSEDSRATLVYYPKESEATETEKNKGEYLRDEVVTANDQDRRRAERAHKSSGRNRSNAISK
ncbi:hypothetical protein BKI52_20255 [marine bacterium AO1-C]|nr:hypothetical protein BKI52_20255 [marine bacterium AO1-C]